MQDRLPQLLRGWRKLLSEVGIIVLGVLIALSAEEFVETQQWQNQVDKFRKALRAELASNAGTYEFRRAQDRCVDSRIAELEEWLRSWRDRRPLNLTGPIGIPASLSLGTSVWNSRNSDLESHMPLEERLLYAKIYDEAANNEVHRTSERNAWIELGNFDGATRLDEDKLMELRGLINQVRYRHERFKINTNAQLGYARDLKIKPQWASTWIAVPYDQCETIVPHRPIRQQ